MGRGHQDPRLPTGRENADRKEATGLDSAGATSSLNGSFDSPVWAETRWRQQTVCRHLEFVWCFQVLKAKKKKKHIWCLQQHRELHLKWHLGLTSKLGLQIQAGSLRVYSLPYGIWLPGNRDFVGGVVSPLESVKFLSKMLIYLPVSKSPKV